jgi:DNA mismatch repair protein MutL
MAAPAMPRIQQLDTHVINRIAAGEVIERPASVVKELLENCVDALSTRIDLEIVNGGMDLIRVVDDGEGIHPEDMLLAVTTHATSKIRSDSDLDHVTTLGFRGEALASIASVSRLRIRTRPHENEVGRELESHGGQIVVNRDCGCPPGTVMEVHNLFFNTPARRRFLKKASTEFSHIVDQFSRIALANPRMHLTLRHNEKLVFELPSAADSVDRIRRFFGNEVADHLIQLSSEAELPDGRKIRLYGHVGEPSLSRATRRDQFLFLNGRWIQDRSLQHALEEAYRGLLMIGRHPVSFLFLDMPPALVDVNVHPTKSEVRFQDGQQLYRQLLKTLRDRFLTLEFRAGLSLPEQSNQDAPPQTLTAQNTPTTASELRFDKPDYAARMPRQMNLTQPRAEFPAPPRVTAAPLTGRTILNHPEVVAALAVPPSQARGSTHSGTPYQLNSTTSDPATLDTADSAESLLAESTVSCSPEIITDEFRAFQIYDCYLVVASDAGLEIIDQHALHERIMYEHLRTKILAGVVESQRLLIPETIECTAVQAAAVLEHSELMTQIGFDIQEFGGTTLLLHSFPVLIPRGSIVRIVLDFAEKLIQKDGRLSRRDLLDHMLHTMSCRAAIKSGQRLALEEMRELLRQRHLVQDSHHCPHGRPTALTLSRHTLDQQFGRLG